MKYLLLFVLSSCAISYYFKGKDLHKNEAKLNKHFDKALNQFKQFEEQSKIFTQLQLAEVPKSFIKEFKQSADKCLQYKNNIIKLKKDRARAFKNLGIHRKKNYSQKDKKYKQIEKFNESNKALQKKVNTVFKSASIACQEPGKIINKNGIRILDAKEVYKNFQNHLTQLNRSESKMNKQIKKLKSLLKKRRHPNKKKIFKKLNELNQIMYEIKAESKNVNLEIKKLNKSYGKSVPIVIAKGTQAYKSMESLRLQTVKYNQLIKNYDQKVKEINKALKY